MSVRLRLLFIVVAAALLWGSIALQPPLWLYPAVFSVIFLFYANTVTERVPLYLTNRTTWAALVELLDHEGKPKGSFIDLGCGLGGTVTYIARAKPQWRVVGVETAPGPYLIAKARSAFLPNAEVRFKSLWKVSLADFDVVYAFLSPAPMPRLLTKAAAEMRPQTLLISNSFWADDQPYDGVVNVNDARTTRLIYTKNQ